MLNLSGNPMASTPKTDKKKKTSTSKYDVALKNKKGSRTLTGKKAAIVDITPRMALMDSSGRPIRESTAVVVWARMNPPSGGHEFVVETANELAVEHSGVPLLVLSRTHGKNNPLSYSSRQALTEEAFGEKIFVVDEDIKNPIEMLKVIAEHFDNIIWLTGEDQVADYQRILEDYNGKEFTFSSAQVVSAGPRIPDSDNLIESISATKLRAAARNRDIETFRNGLPTNLQPRAFEILEEVYDGLMMFEKKPANVKESIIAGIVKQRLTK